tara:strand:- start:492 stop:713 length:222 start_codon:yes stop_codon:yes gene_type:complete
MKLVTHRKANEQFFESGSAPRKSEWREWISSNTVPGKIVGDKIYVDMHQFALRDVMTPPIQSVSAIELLMKSA